MEGNTKKKDCPKFSAYHPVIPKLYTPAWKLDMKNRDRIIENCQLSRQPYQEIDAALYLEKRERLNSSSATIESSKSLELTRNKQLKPSLHSHLSKYQSSLMFRAESM